MKKLFGSAKVSEEAEARCVEAHNTLRRLHGVAPLQPSGHLRRAAQRAADTLAAAGVDTLAAAGPEHPAHCSCYCGEERDATAAVAAALQHWYQEIEHYSFGQEPRENRAPHFTRIVWRDAQLLGVGWARAATGRSYVVCQYEPAPNVPGQYASCVPPPGAAALLYPPRTSPAAPATPATPAAPTNSVAPAATPDKKDYGKIASNLISKLKSPITDSNFEQECLRAHNELRRRHGVEELVLDRELCQYAAEWARELAQRGRMEHRPQTDYGENIYYSWSSEAAAPSGAPSGREPVLKWYAEIAEWEWGREVRGAGAAAAMRAGHFTQVVWAGSRRLGVAAARAPAPHGGLYVVANYAPPGNLLGAFLANVPPPLPSSAPPAPAPAPAHPHT